MLGFGTKITLVFASRWKAVTWSMGVLLLAYCSVPSAEQTRHEAEAKAVHNSVWGKD